MKEDISVQPPMHLLVQKKASADSGSSSSSAVVFCSEGDEVAVFVDEHREVDLDGEWSTYTGVQLS